MSREIFQITLHLKDIQVVVAHCSYFGWREKLPRSQPENENADHDENAMYTHAYFLRLSGADLTNNGGGNNAQNQSNPGKMRVIRKGESWQCY